MGRSEQVVQDFNAHEAETNQHHSRKKICRSMKVETRTSLATTTQQQPHHAILLLLEVVVSAVCVAASTNVVLLGKGSGLISHGIRRLLPHINHTHTPHTTKHHHTHKKTHQHHHTTAAAGWISHHFSCPSKILQPRHFCFKLKSTQHSVQTRDQVLTRVSCC